MELKHYESKNAMSNFSRFVTKCYLGEGDPSLSEALEVLDFLGVAYTSNKFPPMIVLRGAFDRHQIDQMLSGTPVTPYSDDTVTLVNEALAADVMPGEYL